MKNIRVLFLLKKRSSYGISYGLKNSCGFIANWLLLRKIESKVVEVIDANDIDREVYNYKPTHVVIEAIWVTASKMEELIKLHPKIKWTVRVHSKIPFIAHEGFAIEWIRKYNELHTKYHHITNSANSLEFIHEIKLALDIPIDYLPNIYCPEVYDEIQINKNNNEIHVGSFGAIRPFKNQLKQACAALYLANLLNKKLFFHINFNRIETNGESIYHNMCALFKNTEHKLVEHPWANHDDFIKLVKKMDIGLQVSYTETFNIVASDFCSNNIPIVGSSEIDWLPMECQANPNSIEDIVDKMYVNYKDAGRLVKECKSNLDKYNKISSEIWMEWLNKK